VVTRIPAAEMLAGYKRVLETLYQPERFFRRCRENLARWRPAPGAKRPLGLRDLVSGCRAIWTQGIRQRYRWAYWRFLRWVVRHHPAKLARAITQGATGHHYITYTKNVVVPALIEKARLCLPEEHQGQSRQPAQDPAPESSS